MFKVEVDGVMIAVTFSYPVVPIKRNKTRRETHCMINRVNKTPDHMTNRDMIGYGIAKYNPKDEAICNLDPFVKIFHERWKYDYDESKGRKLAFDRALTNAGFDKEVRTLFWGLFMQSERTYKRLAEEKALHAKLRAELKDQHRAENQKKEKV